MYQQNKAIYLVIQQTLCSKATYKWKQSKMGPESKVCKWRTLREKNKHKKCKDVFFCLGQKETKTRSVSFLMT